MGASDFVKQAQKRIDVALDDAKLVSPDGEGGVLVDETLFDWLVVLACLRWAYSAGYNDGLTDRPSFSVNEASEPWAVLPT